VNVCSLSIGMWVTYSKNVDRTNRMYRLNRIYMKSAWNN
jgi:hypothetical protein